MSILLGILTFVLILISIFLVLVVLAQKSKDGGMGAALGGGAAEAAFGADTTNVLSKSTIYAAILFFVLAFVLYLGRIYERKVGTGSGTALPTITAPAAAPAPTTGATSATPAPAAEGAAATGPAVSVPATPAPAPATTPSSEQPKK